MRGRIDRVGVAGQPDLLEPLGQPAHAPRRRCRARRAPAGRPPPAARRRRRRRGSAGRRTSRAARSRGRCRTARRRPSSPSPVVRGRRSRLLVEVAAEPAARSTSCMDATSSWPSTPRTAKRRYSLLRGQPVLEHDHRGDHVGALQVATRRSTRSAAAPRPGRAPPGSPAGRGCGWSGRWRAASCAARGTAAALRATVSSRARLSPRCGTRRSTCAPRRSVSQALHDVRRPSGSAGTSTSRGTPSSPVVAARRTAAAGSARPGRRCVRSSTLSTTQPRWPRTRPPRTWKTWTAASSGSSASAIDVGVGAVAEHDGLLLHRPLEGPDVVAQPGGPLVLLVGRGACISFSSRRRYGLVWPAMKSQKSSTICAVLLGVDPADAGRRALADVAEQARPADLAGPLEDPRRAGAGREDAQQQVEGLADRPGVGVGAEVAHALALGAAHHLQPRELLVQRDGEARVALVVAVLDVEPRVELLDPGVLQLQRLDLGARRRSTRPRPPS